MFLGWYYPFLSRNYIFSICLDAAHYWLLKHLETLLIYFRNNLKRHNQAKFIKKSVLFGLLDMTIIHVCQHVHRLELRNFYKFCVEHLPVKREISTESDFRHA